MAFGKRYKTRTNFIYVEKLSPEIEITQHNEIIIQKKKKSKSRVHYSSVVEAL